MAYKNPKTDVLATVIGLIVLIGFATKYFYPVYQRWQFKSDARAYVLSKLYDPDSAKIREEFLARFDYKGEPVRGLCGQFTATDKYKKGFAGYHWFMVTTEESSLERPYVLMVGDNEDLAETICNDHSPQVPIKRIDLLGF